MIRPLRRIFGCRVCGHIRPNLNCAQCVENMKWSQEL